MYMYTMYIDVRLRGNKCLLSGFQEYMYYMYMHPANCFFTTVCIVWMEHLVSKARRHDVAIDWPETWALDFSQRLPACLEPHALEA